MTCLLLVAAVAIVVVLVAASSGADAEWGGIRARARRFRRLLMAQGGCDLCACRDVCRECGCGQAGHADR
jgi:hypothetical protein